MLSVGGEANPRGVVCVCVCVTLLGFQVCYPLRVQVQHSERKHMEGSHTAAAAADVLQY